MFQAGDKSQYLILGIRHLNLSLEPSTMTIINGGIGLGYVEVLVKAHKGYSIRSTIEFYGKKMDR